MSVWLKAAPVDGLDVSKPEPKTRHVATLAGMKAWYRWEWILLAYCCAEHVKLEEVKMVRRLAEQQQEGCIQGS